ncbi:MAG: HNH endonuclease [Oscillospiraceae bacterium]|nr:HNH endonuclease [Oscillospiraceae bacterium]
MDHIDGNKDNNSATNLRYLSRGDNVRAYQELKKRED